MIRFIFYTACAMALSYVMVVSAQAQSQAQPLMRLEDFLQQVKQKHSGYQASLVAKAAAKLYQKESSLLLSPQIFANAQRSDDQKPNSLYRIDRTLNTTYNVGFSQQTAVGLNAKLYYTYGDTEIRPSSSRTFEARPTLELTQSLWRNFAGHETGATIEMGETKSQVNMWTESYKLKLILLEAEVTYWRLAIAREAVSVQNEALIRAEKLHQWSSKRTQLQLADRSDSLQTDAAVKLKQLELKNATDEELSASQALNSFVDQASTKLGLRLEPLTAEHFTDIDVSTKPKMRDDVRAAELLSKFSAASARLSKEKSKPTFELFGSAALNGSSTDSSRVVGDSWSTDRPTTVIGLRFVAPLDFALTNQVQEGWDKEKYAAEMQYKRKLFEQERDWQFLIMKYQEARQRLRLAQDLVDAQKIKLEYEKNKQARGRSTLAQVLQFELDYDQSQVSRLKTLAELLQIQAQMKVYGE